MQFPTLGDLITRLDRELDLGTDDPISHAEKVDYVNDGIKEAESEIHKLGCEDEYFLASQALPLLTNRQAYPLPSNIYANKIRKIMYTVGTNIYRIDRLRRNKGVSIQEQAANILQFGGDINYQYLIKNDSAAFGNEIWLYPKSRETDSTAVTIWYIRQANVVLEDNDIVDIPEFSAFVLQFAKVKCMRKIFMGNVPDNEVLELERQRENMVTTLREMVPDEDNQIDQEMGFYNDFDSWFIGGIN